LSAYKDLLDNAGRRKLCNLIVRRELQDNPETPIKTQRLLFLAQEITEVFTKEHISTYFIPYINYGKIVNLFNEHNYYLYFFTSSLCFYHLRFISKESSQGKITGLFQQPQKRV